jgi:hypothetical protein
MEHGADQLTVLEDDIVLCRNAASYIRRFVVPEDRAFVSWFSGREPGKLGFIEGNDLLGAQAITFPRRTIEVLMRRKRDEGLMEAPDRLISRLLKRAQSDVTYAIASPSLVQHVGDVSKWCAAPVAERPGLSAKSFDPCFDAFELGGVVVPDAPARRIERPRTTPLLTHPRINIAIVQGQLRWGIFEELVCSLTWALEKLGYETTTYTNERPDQDHPTILLGANMLRNMPNYQIPPMSVIYNLEQVDRCTSWFAEENPQLLNLLRKYPTWDFTHQNVAQLEKWGVKATLVPIGYTPRLTNVPFLPEEKRDIDVLFYGALNDRRQKLLDDLYTRGVKVINIGGKYRSSAAPPYAMPPMFGFNRDQYVARSKIILNLHYYECRMLEVVRISYLLANRCFVLSEPGANSMDNQPFDGGPVFALYDQLVEKCMRWLGTPEQRTRRAEAGFQLMRSMPTEQFVDIPVRRFLRSCMS